ncbi:O-methyltransferase, family 2 [Corchorus olitorius]|uniref:O-methyltransferase, family 2 n=1 Tax=Corchorus olitorius TaxID=93759 RepID=A0A1R3HIA9_9ROSI|nr:O-methyltransferase, family 2 [Corchorus olitorius]
MESSAENQFVSKSYNAEEDDEEAFSYAFQIVESMALPMSLHTAIQLEVFEIIAKAGPDAKLSAKEIAAQLPTHKNPEAPSMLDRILSVLATHFIVGCSLGNDEVGGNPERVYCLRPLSKYFVRNQDGVSLGPFMSLLHDKIFLASWSQLKDAILEGGVPFGRVHGTHAFEYLGRDAIMKKILETYKGFEKLNRVVDVGGGLGITLNMITSKYPSIKGINFDLPYVIRHAPAYPGVEHVGGNMFESVPNGDTIFMKWILHDWSDEHCIKLLKNCYKAIPDDGKVIVLDAVLPFLPEPNAFVRGTLMLDVILMAQIPGGKERTKSEFEALATKAGFSGIRYECFVYNFCVMEFFK